MRSGRSSSTPRSLRGEAAAVIRRLIEPQTLDRELAGVFDAEGLDRCAVGARGFGQVAIAMLLASAAISFVVNDPFAGHLFLLRLLGASAIAAVLWHLRSATAGIPTSAAVAIVLMLAATGRGPRRVYRGSEHASSTTRAHPVRRPRCLGGHQSRGP
jgi:hypothetical protein